MNYEQLLQARAEAHKFALAAIDDALQALTRSDACPCFKCLIESSEAAALAIREAKEQLEGSASLVANTKPDYLCEHGDCRIVALAGAAWCWPHLTEGRNVCAVKGCKCPTRDRILICTDHMAEYVAHASLTGKYEMQGWLIARLEVARGPV